jgi:hypothetical protein
MAALLAATKSVWPGEKVKMLKAESRKLKPNLKAESRKQKAKIIHVAGLIRLQFLILCISAPPPTDDCPLKNFFDFHFPNFCFFF